MISKLLKLEWSKFRKNSTISLLMIFFIIFFPASLYFGRILDNIAEHLPMNVDIFDASLIWDYLGYAGNWIVFFFLGVLVIYTVTIDVANKTMRQNIITGLSRKDFYLSKFMIVIVLSVFATIYYFLLATVIGWINTDGASISKMMDNDAAPFRFLLMSLGYLNFALLLAFLIRKAGIAVFVYLTYGLLGEPLLKIWLQKYVTESGVVNYLPMNATEDLMPAPVLKMASDFNSKVDAYLLTYAEAGITTIVFGIIFIVLGFWVFKNKDI